MVHIILLPGFKASLGTVLALYMMPLHALELGNAGFEAEVGKSDELSGWEVLSNGQVVETDFSINLAGPVVQRPVARRTSF